MKVIKKGKNFADMVRDIVRAIPKGQVLTYGQVAQRAGHPGAARAVGTIMANNYDKTVPCHRVIRSDGKIGNYNRGGSEAKKKLLKAEGYKFDKKIN
jgi:methylated-DNA-[protein]-cysteine S-methyltransferase